LATAPSALFVLQRFFLLSHAALAPLAAFGVLALAQFVARSTGSTQSFALRIAATTCLAAVVISVATDYRRIDQSRNSVARHFGEDVFNAIRPNSILVVSGDGLAFPLIYLQKVENVGKETTLVVLPLLLGEWYVRQLRDQHPDLISPFEYFRSGHSEYLRIPGAQHRRQLRTRRLESGSPDLVQARARDQSAVFKSTRGVGATGTLIL